MFIHYFYCFFSQTGVRIENESSENARIKSPKPSGFSPGQNKRRKNEKIVRWKLDEENREAPPSEGPPGALKEGPPSMSKVIFVRAAND